MERRAEATANIRSIRSAMAARGVTEESVAEAADITLADLDARLNGDTEFMVSELVRVGGFLRLPLSQLFPEAA